MDEGESGKRDASVTVKKLSESQRDTTNTAAAPGLSKSARRRRRLKANIELMVAAIIEANESAQKGKIVRGTEGPQRDGGSLQVARKYDVKTCFRIGVHMPAEIEEEMAEELAHVRRMMGEVKTRS